MATTPGFLDLPSEVRLAIYASLFDEPVLLLRENSQCSGLVGCYRRKRNNFDKANVHTNILLTCRKVYYEGRKVLYDNLVLSQGHHQYMSVSSLAPETLANVKTVENVQLDYAILEAFHNLKTLLYKHVLHVIMRNEDGQPIQFEPRALFTGAVRSDVVLYDYYTARKHCGYQIAKAIQVRRIDVMAEIRIKQCLADDCRASAYGHCSPELTTITHLTSCSARHVEVGTMYLDFNKARAYLDRGDRLGKAASLKKLASLE